MCMQTFKPSCSYDHVSHTASTCRLRGSDYKATTQFGATSPADTGSGPNFKSADNIYKQKVLLSPENSQKLVASDVVLNSNNAHTNNKKDTCEAKRESDEQIHKNGNTHSCDISVDCHSLHSTVKDSCSIREKNSSRCSSSGAHSQESLKDTGSTLQAK